MKMNFSEFIRFFQKGLNPLKVQGRFNFEFVPEFITCNPKRILSCVKKESCSLCFKLSLYKVWRILNIGKTLVLDFKI
jgi:hypothetical protein